MIVDSLVAVLGYEMRGESDLRRFNQSLERTEKRMAAFAAAAARWGAVAGAAIGAGLAGLASKVVSTSAKFEGFEAALETIEGSSEKARESMDWISKFARSTPYDVAGLTDAFIKLRTYGIDPLADDAMRTLGDAASAMNKPLNQAVEALADATTFQFERLREFGLVASQKGDEVTFKWNKAGEELTRTVRKNGEEIRKFILENLGSRFNGAMLRQSTTWNGMISNLGDAWTDFQLRIGRGGFFDAVKARLADFLDYIGELDENGTLDRWSQRLSDGFTTAVDVIGASIERLTAIGKAIGKLFGSDSAIWGLSAFASAIILRAFPLAAGITAIVLALDDLWSFFEGKESVLGNWLKDHPKLAGALKAVGDAVGEFAPTLGSMLEYIGPVLGFAGALVLLAPALRAVSSALLALTGIKMAWGVVAWLAALAGIGKSASGIAALGAGLASVAASLASIAGLASVAAIIATPGAAADNEYTNASAEDRAKMREDAATDAATYNMGYNPQTGRGYGPRNSRRGALRGERERDRSLGAFLENAGRSGAPSRSMDALVASMENFVANMQKVSPDGAAQTVTEDNRVANDNRSFPMETSVIVHQTVTSAVAAPGAVARSVGNAAAGAVNQQRSRLAAPAMSGNGPQ